MRQRAVALAAAILAVFCLQSDLVRAQSPSGGLEVPIGKVITLEGQATIEHKGVVAVQASLTQGPVSAKVGDSVYQGDIVQTAADGKLGLVFADGTALNVLTNARMVLDEFIYDAHGKRNSSAFRLVKGALTVVGGKMARNGAMRVETTVATMGIRGTSAYIVVNEDGSVRFTTLIEEKH